jgi:hypothetical protein
MMWRITGVVEKFYNAPYLSNNRQQQRGGKEK